MWFMITRLIGVRKTGVAELDQQMETKDQLVNNYQGLLMVKGEVDVGSW